MFAVNFIEVREKKWDRFALQVENNSLFISNKKKKR